MPEARGGLGPDRADILFFLEDPGAVNFVLGLPEACGERGFGAVLAAAGPARAYLAERGITFLALGGPEEALSLLARARPRLAVLGTADRPDALNLALADACRALGIPSAGIVDGWGNLERRFRGTGVDPLAHAPDWILVPDGPSRDAYVAFGHPPEKVAACGHPALDRARAEARRLAGADRRALRERLVPGAPPGSPLLVFAAEIFRTPDPAQYRIDADYTLRGSGRFQGRTEIVLEEVLDALEAPEVRGPGPAPFLVLRLHPKNVPEDFAPFLGLVGGVSRGGPALELVHAADAVIGMTTILLAEAACLGRPTLAAVPRPVERDWLWTIRAGITRCAGTRSELRRELADLVAAVRGGGGAPTGGEASSAPDSEDRLLAFFAARLAPAARP